MAAAPYTCSLSPALLKKAEEELHETPESRERELRKLRDLIRQHGALHCKTDDAYLLRFLRARKFDSDRAIKVIIKYFTFRAEHRETHGRLLPSLAKNCLESHMAVMLPNRDREGRKILYIRPGRWDPEKFGIMDSIKIHLMNLEQVVMDEETQVNGVISIGDFGEVGMTHVINMDRNFPKTMNGIMEEAFPLRFKGSHFVNEPSVFGLLFSIMKPFMSEKIKSRMNFHGSDRESLHKVFDLDMLPEELGGTLPSIEKLAEDWKNRMYGQEKFYESLDDHYIELPKKVDTVPKDVGVVGTAFRKLEVD